MPTFQRGTPEMIAKILVGAYDIWLFDVVTKDFPSEQGGPSYQDDHPIPRSGT